MALSIRPDGNDYQAQTCQGLDRNMRIEHTSRKHDCIFRVAEMVSILDSDASLSGSTTISENVDNWAEIGMQDSFRAVHPDEVACCGATGAPHYDPFSQRLNAFAPLD